MENKNNRPSNTIITRTTNDFSKMTNNVYKTVVVMSRRANQLAIEEKKEINKKIDEFTVVDTGEEVYENRERVEIVRHYEQMPKPTLVAIQEFLNDELECNNPTKDNDTKVGELENEVLAKK